eukprot:GFUD01073616.1.p2 GENE.GFUD01073616.1~~GFUD01073616.1.p2  ORF type:complete len:160 (+),score=33.44 GFUD01073616.1:664-1143(+)
MAYTYGISRESYDGCINRRTPGQYVNVVPNFGDNSPAPKDQEDFFEEFDLEEDEGLDDARVSFGGSFGPRSRKVNKKQVKKRKAREVRTLFWCATAVDPSGYVMEWGKCAAGCKADPAGTYLPAAPRRGNVGFTRARRGQTVGDFIKIIRKGNSRNSRL